jgi:hypothetical protein
MVRFPALAAAVLSTLLLGGGVSPVEAQTLAQRVAEKTVRYPGRAEEPGDLRGAFAADLLALVLAKSDEGFRLEIVGGMNQPRRIQAAHEGLVDVVTLPHHATAKSRLIPVRHPLQRGLLGVRVLLARPEMAERLMTVASVEELKRDYVMGYGATWLDREVMAGLGFRMEYGSRYTGLFEMLRAGRFDYLTRAVGELHAERQQPQLAGSGLVVVPGIALYYPLDHYFHVSPQRPALARSIQRGFQRALADGSYAALFERHYGEAMREIGLSERSIVHVLGYPVPRDTPLEEFDVLGLVRSRGVFQPLSEPADSD